MKFLQAYYFYFLGSVVILATKSAAGTIRTSTNVAQWNKKVFLGVELLYESFHVPHLTKYLTDQIKICIPDLYLNISLFNK